MTQYCRRLCTTTAVAAAGAAGASAAVYIEMIG